MYVLAEQQAAQQSQVIKIFSQLLSQNNQAAASSTAAAPATADGNGLEVSASVSAVNVGGGLYKEPLEQGHSAYGYPMNSAAIHGCFLGLAVA